MHLLNDISNLRSRIKVLESLAEVQFHSPEEIDDLQIRLMILEAQVIRTQEAVTNSYQSG
jgi:hypothetical protein